MSHRQRGSDTDPSTVDGKMSSSLGGGGGVGLLDNPLKNVYPPGYRISSQYKTLGGFTSPLVTPPPPSTNAELRSSYSVVEDPTDGDLLLIGYTESFGNGPTLPIYSYDFQDNTWSTSKYPQLGNVSNFTEKIMNFSALTVGDSLYIIGGQNADGINQTTITYLDLSASSPTWQQDDKLLSEPNFRPYVFSYNNEIYVFDSTERGGGTQYDTETGMTGGINSNWDFFISNGSSRPSPVVDGEVYFIVGFLDGTIPGVTDDSSYNRGQTFVKYDIEADEFTELAPMELFQNVGGEPGTGEGWGYGIFEQVTDDLLYAIGGYNQFSLINSAVYSISSDKWAPVEKKPLLGDIVEDDLSNNPPLNSFGGSKVGVNINGVIYHAMSGQTEENQLAQHFPPVNFEDHT